MESNAQVTDRKERIVREAAEMFLEEGIKSVRMDDIATRLGVSKRTLYEMFTDRGDLLEQSMAHYFERMRRRMAERRSGAANVMEEVFIMMGSVKKDERHRALMVNLRKFHPEVYRRLEDDAHAAWHAEFDRILARGIEQGLFVEDINRELALLTLTYSMHALFDVFDRRSRRLAEHGEVPIDTMFEYVVVNFFRGLSTHKGIELIDGLVKTRREKQSKSK